MATKDSIMKQSIFFWVFGHRLSFEYGLKKFLFGAWRNLSGALRELILNSEIYAEDNKVHLKAKHLYMCHHLHMQIRCPYNILFNEKFFKQCLITFIYTA